VNEGVGSGRWSWVSFFAVWAFGRRAGAGQGPYFLRIFTSPLASACPPRSSSRRPGPGPNSAARGEEVGGEGRRSTAVLLGRPAPPAAPCPLEARWGQLVNCHAHPTHPSLTHSLTHSHSLIISHSTLYSRLTPHESRAEQAAQSVQYVRHAARCSLGARVLAAARYTHTHTRTPPCDERHHW
jgi:hypothetical protein